MFYNNYTYKIKIMWLKSSCGKKSIYGVFFKEVDQFTENLLLLCIASGILCAKYMRRGRDSLPPLRILLF
jgi:hypothetical protein